MTLVTPRATMLKNEITHKSQVTINTRGDRLLSVIKV